MFSMTRTRWVFALAAVTLLATFVTPAQALDAEHRQKAEEALARAFHYLRANQNPDGSWTPKPGPAITAMVAARMLHSAEITKAHPAVAKAVKYVMSRQKSDGGFYDHILGNYNTSMTLMLIGPLRESDPQIADAVKKAQDYLRGIQWAGQKDPNGETIDEDHRWFGGAGYGGNGRPDLSNTAMMIAGLNDSGLVCTDPA